jgi:predicted dienelactone hydrolase
MTIGTNSIWQFPESRRDALLDALVTLKGENTRSDSPLLGQLDVNRLAVGGWSMGGGGAQLAAVADPSIKAVVALCPWLDSGSLSPADINHAAPILFFCAENDVIAPPANHADVQYDYTPLTTHKMLFEIAGGSHQAANDPINGDVFVGQIAVSWLKNYLVGDICYCPLVLETPPSASQYLLNITCVCPVDVNGDGVISVPDILVLLAEFACVSGCTADINGDDATNVQDLLLLLSVFGSAC